MTTTMTEGYQPNIPRILHDSQRRCAQTQMQFYRDSSADNMVLSHKQAKNLSRLQKEQTIMYSQSNFLNKNYESMQEVSSLEQ